MLDVKTSEISYELLETSTIFLVLIGLGIQMLSLFS